MKNKVFFYYLHRIKKKKKKDSFFFLFTCFKKKKKRKKGSKEGCQKEHEIVFEFWMKNVRFGGLKIIKFCSFLKVFRLFRLFRTFSGVAKFAIKSEATFVWFRKSYFATFINIFDTNMLKTCSKMLWKIKNIKFSCSKMLKSFETRRNRFLKIVFDWCGAIYIFHI